jgi:hypothetical protein
MPSMDGPNCREGEEDVDVEDSIRRRCPIANGRADALASKALMNKNPPLFGCNG